MLKVIRGGLDPAMAAGYKFICGEVTDTRLMGVVGLHLAWQPEEPGFSSVHQFLYYDYEELGLDHVQLYSGDDPAELEIEKSRFFAGLGASLVSVTEKEGRYLAGFFIAETKRRNIPLPLFADKLEFAVSGQPELSPQEIRALNLKMCAPVRTDYGVVNYYVMRCMGADTEGANLLLASGADAEYITPGSQASFLRNKITSLDTRRYRCESVAEAGDSHYMVVSEIRTYRRKVVYAKVISVSRLSIYEASMLLTREEFTSVYEISETADEDLIMEMVDYFSKGGIKHPYNAGELCTIFRPDNSHVEKKLFMLSDDVRLLYFFTLYGQILITAYSFEDILEAEARILSGKYRSLLYNSGRYRFANPLLLDFADSDYDDFNDFVDNLDGGDED